MVEGVGEGKKGEGVHRVVEKVGEGEGEEARGEVVDWCEVFSHNDAQERGRRWSTN